MPEESSELKDRAIEIINTNNRKKRDFKKMNRSLGTCGVETEDLTFMLSVSEEGKEH